jgi:hypothetical protein
MAVLVLRADDWELRCRYNKARLFERWLTDEFKTKYGEPGEPDPESGQPPNSISLMAYYYDRATGDLIAKIHHFILANGDIGGRGRHDPKGLLLDGVQYRQNKGLPKVNRDPSLNFPDGAKREAYKDFRRWCCRFLGPDLDRFLASIDWICSFGTWMMRLVKSASRSSDEPLSGSSASSEVGE